MPRSGGWVKADLIIGGINFASALALGRSYTIIYTCEPTVQMLKDIQHRRIDAALKRDFSSDSCHVITVEELFCHSPSRPPYPHVTSLELPH